MPFSAPTFNGDYSDMYAAMTEAAFLAAWCYQNDLIQHLKKWNEWLAANAKRIQLKSEEQANWTALCERAAQVDMEADVSALKAVAEEMADFWTAYMQR
jgi:hypothetical protein